MRVPPQELFDKTFIRAIKDYFLFIEKNYPKKTLIKLVGDRYLLNKTQRTILYRGIFKKKEIKRRKKMKARKISGKDIFVDCYNVIYTIANYLYGRPMYIGNDNFLRDAGDSLGKIPYNDIFYKSVDMVFEFLKKENPRSVTFLIDEPVSYSGELAFALNKRIGELPFRGMALTVKSPDYRLKNIQEGVIATSDSAIIDKAKVKVFDMAREILKRKYKPCFIHLKRYL